MNHFQWEVQLWMRRCFGQKISDDVVERNHRFLEEALELIQACGATKSEAHQLVEYVFDRPVGEPEQEVGGVMVTLAALCYANRMDLKTCADNELSRVWCSMKEIRKKQATKPKHSPLPQVEKS